MRSALKLSSPLAGLGAVVAFTLLVEGCSSDESNVTAQGGAGGQDGGTGGSIAPDGGADALPPPSGPKLTVEPTEIGDILGNPGMGVTEFHGYVPPPPEHPPATVAYYRWSWAAVEPAEGLYAFEIVDDAIKEAKSKGQTLAFRIMSHWKSSTPQWLIDKGVGSVTVPDGAFPDHNHALFLEHHQKLLKAFGDRYAGSVDVDHVDIGSVGCWGEWNTACCETNESTCKSYYPTDANQKKIVDWYFQYFPKTPLVALIGGQAEYATGLGAGWRGDCYGDMPETAGEWNHMDYYQEKTEDPSIGAAWKKAPVQMEVCGVMQDWYDKGFDIDFILQKGLEWHMSVLNLKSSPVPASWRTKVDEFLKKVGYRMVLVKLTHEAKASPGGSLRLTSEWANRGVAPFYHPWPLAYRLRSGSDVVVAEWKSSANLESWLPGEHSVDDLVGVPAGVTAGKYALDVAILDEAGSTAHVELAIAGKRDDKWYAVSEVEIK